MIGSQAILASLPEERLPPGATMSVEADIVPLDDRDGTKSMNGSIGEESMFHETFGVYAHGVGERTARLPEGWRDRLVPLSNDNTNGLTGWCLEPHDLVVANSSRAGRRTVASAARCCLVGSSTRRSSTGSRTPPRPMKSVMAWQGPSGRSVPRVLTVAEPAARSTPPAGGAMCCAPAGPGTCWSA